MAQDAKIEPPKEWEDLQARIVRSCAHFLRPISHRLQVLREHALFILRSFAICGGRLCCGRNQLSLGQPARASAGTRSAVALNGRGRGPETRVLQCDAQHIQLSGARVLSQARIPYRCHH